MLIKILLPVALLMICIGPAFAQSGISGRAVGADRQGVAGASAYLLRQRDSAVTNKAEADSLGVFRISRVPQGIYILEISATGFTTYFKTLDVNGADINTGEITMKRKTQMIQEVTVAGEKKMFEVSGDKVIMNLAGNPITAGLNGLELLEKLPGVTVNRQSETVQLNGKSGVTVMIDDRQTYLTGQQLSNFLKTLRSDNIDKVEIISNPSMRYEASGTAGVINLKTKRNKGYGTNFTIDGGFRYGTYTKYGDYPQDNQALSVNVRKQKFSFYGNISRNHVREFWANDDQQEFFGANGAVIEHRSSTDFEKGRYNSWNSKLSMDYYLSKRSTLGLSLSGSLFDGHRDGNLSQISDNAAYGTDINTAHDRSDKFRTYIINTHYGHVNDSAGIAIAMDFDIIFNRSNNQTEFANEFFKSVQDSMTFNALNTKGSGAAYVFSGSLEKRIGKKTRLEAGWKARFSSNKNNYADNFIDNGPLRHDYFNFNENIDGAYLMINRQLDANTKVQLGIRGEQTNNRGLDSAGNRLSGQNYLNLFPAFVINRKVSKTNTLSLGYSRRINRPGSGVFNTYKLFSSTLSYFEGNPSALPSLYNSFTMSDLIKNKYLVELGYVNIKRFATTVYDVDTVLIPGRNLTKSTFENVGGKVSWWHLKFILPLDITKWWTFNIQVYGGINVYDYQRKNTVVDTTQLYWGASLQQGFTLAPGFTAQIGGWINSGETSGFKSTRPSGTLDLGIRKLILKRSGALKLSFQDPFLFNYSRSTINTGVYTDHGVFRWNSRMLIIGFTYNFGNRNVNVNKWQERYQENNVEGKN